MEQPFRDDWNGCFWEGEVPLKINEYKQPEIPEDHIDIYYRKKTKEISDILKDLKKHRQKLVGKADGKEIIFSLHNVYYFESVDKKTFACLNQEVIQIPVSLQDLENAYFELGFVRVNKSTIVNVYKIDSLKPELNMRVTALLDNGERIRINRSYKPKFNLFLNAMNKGGFQHEDCE